MRSMKKIVAMALTIALVLVLVPALSAGAKWSTETHSTVVGFSSGDMLDDREVWDFGKLILGKDTQVLKIFLKDKNLDYGAGNPIDPAQVTQNLMGFMPLEYRWDGSSQEPTANAEGWVRYPDPRIFKAVPNADGITDPTDPNREEAVYTLTAEGIGKVDMEVRVVFLNPDDTEDVLQVSDSIDVVGEYLDPTINKNIVALSGLNLKEASFALDGKRPENTIRLNNDRLSLSNLEDLTIVPGDILRIDLNTEHFVWDPDIIEMATSVRKSSLENDHVSLIRKVIAGNNFIESAGFENINGAAEIVIRFKDTYNKVEPSDFEFHLALGQYGQRNEDTSITFAGSFGNEIYQVYTDNDYVYVGDNMVAEAVNNVKNIELDLGEGVVVTLNMFKDQRYIGKATSAQDDDSKAVMNYFPDIRKCLRLTSHNVSQRARFVTLHDQETNYYVYDADGQYLGRSADKLEYRDRYYLSVAEIDFTADMIDDLIPLEEDLADNPSTGGSTGTNMASLVVVASLAILSAAAAVLSKKDDEKTK